MRGEAGTQFRRGCAQGPFARAFGGLDGVQAVSERPLEQVVVVGRALRRNKAQIFLWQGQDATVPQAGRAMRTSGRRACGDDAGEMMWQVFIVRRGPRSSVQRRQANDGVRRGAFNKQTGGGAMSMRETLQPDHHGNSADISPGRRRLGAYLLTLKFSS